MVKSLNHEFLSLRSNNPELIKQDENAIAVLLGVEFTQECLGIHQTNTIIQNHLKTLGDWEIRPQRMLKAQGALTCEFSSIQAFNAHLFGDEVVFQFFKIVINQHAMTLANRLDAIEEETKDLLSIRVASSKKNAKRLWVSLTVLVLWVILAL